MTADELDRVYCFRCAQFEIRLDPNSPKFIRGRLAIFTRRGLTISKTPSRTMHLLLRQDAMRSLKTRCGRCVFDKTEAMLPEIRPSATFYYPITTLNSQHRHCSLRIHPMESSLRAVLPAIMIRDGLLIHMTARVLRSSLHQQTRSICFLISFSNLCPPSTNFAYAMTISIFCRMLSIQSHSTVPPVTRPMDLSSANTPTFTPIAYQPTKTILFDTSSPVINNSAKDTPRYSKRKRSQVAYHKIDEDEFLLSSDADEEYEPKAKVCHRRKDV